MNEEIEQRVSQLYVRIFDTLGQHVTLPTRDAKHLAQYAYEKFLEAKQERVRAAALEASLTEHRAAGNVLAATLEHFETSCGWAKHKLGQCADPWPYEAVEAWHALLAAEPSDRGAALLEALRWYADEGNYEESERHVEPSEQGKAMGMGPLQYEASNVSEDRGERARAALAPAPRAGEGGA